MDGYKKLSQYDIRTVLSMTDLFPTLVDNGDGTYTNTIVPLSAIRTYSAVPSGGTTSQVLKKTNNTDYATSWVTADRAFVGLGNVDNTSDVNKPVSTAVTTAIQALYPIGSIYINATNSTNPGTLLGFGTWVAFGAGRVPVGKASSGTFNAIGATGGEETHVLITSEMPSHDHGGRVAGTSNGDFFSWTDGSGGSGWGVAQAANNNGRHMTIPSAGSDGAHNNLQPYVVVYMWQRTA